MQAGARFFQLRDKQVEWPTLQTIGQQLTEIAGSTETIWLTNTHTRSVMLPGFDGVHRPGYGLPIAELRERLGSTAIIGVSTHSLEEAIEAEEQGATFVTISPVFLSASKPGYGPALHLEGLAQVARNLTIPVYALGGILPENTLDCLHAGAYGVAIMGGIMGAAKPRDVTLQYLGAIQSFDSVNS